MLGLPESSDELVLDAALGADEELAEDVHPLLSGQFGDAARELFGSCLAAQLRARPAPRAALVPALADALLLAERMGGAER